MIKNLKPILFVIVLAGLSLIYGANIKSYVIGFTNSIVSTYDDVYSNIKSEIEKYQNQASTIEKLTKENKELRKSAVLLSTFATELNQFLADKNASIYSPNVQLVRALFYSSLGDYNKFWIDFKDFKKDRIYGLIYKGKSAGIVINKDSKPLAILQRDPKCTFSIYIGETKIPGIATGNNKNITIKFIPQWLEPKVGDEVFTSGLDDIFFSGVPVGRISSVFESDFYKSAIVEPYENPNMPTYLYVITKEF